MTLKQFTEKWTGRTENGYTVNRCFSFKPWFGNFEGQTVYVAAEYSRGWWEAIHAETKDGKCFDMVCTNGESKSDLINMIMGC